MRVSRRDGIQDTVNSSKYTRILSTSSLSTVDKGKSAHGIMISANVVRLHLSCVSGIVNRTKTLSYETLSNKDVMGESDKEQKAVVRWTGSGFPRETVAESEVRDVHSFESMFSVDCSSIKRIESV